VVIDLAVAHDLGAKLDVLGVPWVIVGSVASSMLGEPRATADVDLVADLRGAQIGAFCRSIEEAYYVDEETARWAASTRRSFNVIHQPTVTKIDIFCCKADPLSRAQLQRRIFADIGGRATPFLAPEDVILQKLRWLQELGTSDRQWRDALGVLRIRWAVLDQQYLHEQARDNGLDDLLAKLLSEREPS
jgi:hypothetical protein